MTTGETKPVDRESLLVNELAEINNYARSWVGVYVSWYTMVFTVNVALIGSLIAYHEQISKAASLAHWVFGVNALIDLFSVGYTLCFCAYLVSSDERVTAILNSLTGGQDDARANPRSPIPRRSLIWIYGLAAAALSLLVLLWTTLFYYPDHFF
jgi:hypothetical protein